MMKSESLPADIYKEHEHFFNKKFSFLYCPQYLGTSCYKYIINQHKLSPKGSEPLNMILNR